MFHEMPLKMYFMKYSERNVSQRILALRTDNCAIISPGLLIVMNTIVIISQLKKRLRLTCLLMDSY